MIGVVRAINKVCKSPLGYSTRVLDIEYNINLHKWHSYCFIWGSRDSRVKRVIILIRVSGVSRIS